jgi:hypothetical protein
MVPHVALCHVKIFIYMHTESHTGKKFVFFFILDLRPLGIAKSLSILVSPTFLRWQERLGKYPRELYKVFQPGVCEC